MLAEAPHNKCKAKDKWTPPQGYKSALGRARDAARAVDPGKKKGNTISALTEAEAEDTASDDDGEYSQAGRNFSMCALRLPFSTVVKKA